MYQAKLEELRRIKNKLKEVEEMEDSRRGLEQTTVVVVGDKMGCGLFRKKEYVEEGTPRINNC